jgi:peptidoglycan/xylan/chitin deacetylase (PgdA/CDA1 family)
MWRCWMMRWMAAVVLLAAVPAYAAAAGPGAPVAMAAGQAQMARALRFGDRGQAVATLQQQLRAAGLDPGPVDGIFGPVTQAAVRRAQALLGLEVDGLAGPRTAAGLGSRRGQQGAEARAPVGPRTFALTFHGDPDPELLPRLLDALKANGMQATFFIRGETAERATQLVSMIAAAGHEIGNAGFAEIDMTRISDEMRKAQLRRAQLAITEAAGQAPAYFRPPLGRFSDALQQVAADQKLTLSLWTNVGIRDLPDLAAGELVGRLGASLYPGAVLMLHQDRANAVAALESLLPALRQQGYRSTGLSQMAAEQNRR